MYIFGKLKSLLPWRQVQTAVAKRQTAVLLDSLPRNGRFCIVTTCLPRGWTRWLLSHRHT